MKAKAPWVVALIVASGLSIALVFLWTGERQRVSIDEPPDLSAATGEARSDEDITSAGATDASSETIIEDQARNVTASVSGEEQQQEAKAFPELPPAMTQALQDDIELLPPIPEFAQTVRDFASQLDDAAWSETTESHIFGQISQATGLGASDIQVDCRTTMCRVRLSNPVSTQNPRYRSLNELVDTFGLETLSLWAGPDSNGNPVNLVYLRRSGPPAPQSETR
jgi:hypothetical protein